MVPKDERQSFSAKGIVKNGAILMVAYISVLTILIWLGVLTPGHL